MHLISDSVRILRFRRPPYHFKRLFFYLVFD